MSSNSASAVSGSEPATAEDTVPGMMATGPVPAAAAGPPSVATPALAEAVAPGAATAMAAALGSAAAEAEAALLVPAAAEA